MVPHLTFWIAPDGATVLAVSTSDEQSKDVALELVHCFGHIHEGWGAERMNWVTKTSERILVNREKTLA